MANLIVAFHNFANTPKKLKTGVSSIARNCAAVLAQPSDSAEYLLHYGRSVTVRGERKVQRKKSCRCENCTFSQQYALYSEKSTVRRGGGGGGWVETCFLSLRYVLGFYDALLSINFFFLLALQAIKGCILQPSSGL
jgi:hypothetical protein